MTRVLILGLGNPLMGDDGIGCRAAQLLADDPRLPLDVECLPGGTDLLRWMDRIEGHEHVILIDAILGEPDARIAILHDDFHGVSLRQANAHSLSLPQAIALIRGADSAFCKVRFTIIAVPVSEIAMRIGLSPRVEAQLPAILDIVLLETLADVSPKGA